QLGETLARLRESLLRLASRSLGREGPLACQLGGAIGLARIGRRRAELETRRFHAAPRLALLRGERAKALLVIGDPLLGRGDLLVERVSQADQRGAPVLARRGIEPCGLRPPRRLRVRVVRRLLGA